jgi:uncharacterized membrane-anchored protein
MKRWLAITVAAAQVSLLAWMAAEREWVIQTGERIWLRTAPVDPRDPMRGDYVRLAYDISTADRSICQGGLAAWFAETPPEGSPRDLRVYAVLAFDGGIARLVALTDVRPEGGLFIRGRIDRIGDVDARVRYGLEALFMQQGTARDLELQRFGDMADVPMDAEVAVGPGGLAVLVGHRWEPLGLRVTLERRESPAPSPALPAPGRPAPGIVAAVLELRNHGDTPLAIVDRAGNRSFRLVGQRAWDESIWQWVGRDLPVPEPLPAEVVVLAPGGTWTRRIDLASPEWFVVEHPAGSDKAPKAPVSLESLVDHWPPRFRFEYVAPTAEQCAALPHGESIRRPSVRSRAFSPGGSVD